MQAYSKDEAVNIGFYLGIYTAISVGVLLAESIEYLAFTWGGWVAAQRLHTLFINAVMNAPLSWFSTVPVGRIVNRVSRDMMALDSSLGTTVMVFVDQAFKLFLGVAAVSTVLPVFALPALFLSSLGVVAGEMYTRTSVVVKKLLSSSQSPVFSLFSDTLAGLSVIRAREDMAEQFQDRLAEQLRAYSQAMSTGFSMFLSSGPFDPGHWLTGSRLQPLGCY